MDRAEAAEEFYDALAPLFDVMTDWQARLTSEGPFLLELLRQAQARRVLDAACGSGGHALWLAQQSYQVVGADVSRGMIALAQQKAAAAGLDVPFVVSDLANLASSLRGSPVLVRQTQGVGGAPWRAGEEFDAVLCLGNSLPHLLTHEDLVAALRGIADVMRPGGLLVVHNLNYDLRWQTQPRWFAAQGGVMDGQEAVVWRFADYDLPAQRIAFHIALFRRSEQGWSVQVHTTWQRPLFQPDLLLALHEAGFGDARAYGRMVLPFESFVRDARAAEGRGAGPSADLVLAASKRANA